MKKLYDAVYTEKYTDKKTGEEKKKYTNVGAVLQRDDGSLCMAFLGSWINFYEPKMKAEGYQAAREAASAPNDDMEDEIPF